ncbi:MAG: ATP synthase F1 subunit gamma [Omnitrophica bacterium GWA2_52_8]|nr:MAG: ATP synthase F1 subunit gamma [Omnitrophica bacterium GWA2_52_8]
MSGQLRALKNRIRSVESTKKITRAMEMVAAAKLHRYQDLMSKGRAYANGLENLLRRAGGCVSESTKEAPPHPFLQQREEKKVGLVLFASDTGLCGSYNTDLIACALRFLETRQEPVLPLGVGKNGIKALRRRGYSVHTAFQDIRISQMEKVLSDLKSLLEKLYLSGEVDAIYVVYNHAVSVVNYKTVTQKLLPLEKPEAGTASGTDEVYIFEPSEKIILDRLIPLFFESKTRQIFLEAFVTEQMARMRAMHQATENASDMIKALVLQRNKARQAAITKEIIEIVSGSQALKS